MTDQIVALPLYEPMYINGQLSSTWAMFFNQLIGLLDSIGGNNGADLDGLQALMHALPNSSISGQQSLIKAITPLVQTTTLHNQIQQAVDAVELPTSQVITP